MRNAASSRALRQLRNVRAKAEKRFYKKPNVLGSMLGLRIAQGQVLNELVLTVFVRKKIPTEAIPQSERIPRRVTINQTVVSTDVIEINGFVFQAGSPFPTAGALTTSDATEFGTMTAFARSKFDLFGLTCAHAIEGPDNNPYTQTRVGVWSPSLKRAIPVGDSAFALAGGGAGVPGAYGFMDAALFTLVDRDLRNRANKGAVIPVAAPRMGAAVRGDATSGPKTGTIIGIEKRVGPHLADIVVRVDPPGTFKGDSGMLWRSSSGGGHAIGIHALGDGVFPGRGSNLSAAMSAARAAEGLSVDLVEG